MTDEAEPVSAMSVSALATVRQALNYAPHDQSCGLNQSGRRPCDCYKREAKAAMDSLDDAVKHSGTWGHSWECVTGGGCVCGLAMFRALIRSRGGRTPDEPVVLSRREALAVLSAMDPMPRYERERTLLASRIDRCTATSEDGERCTYKQGHDLSGVPHSWKLYGFRGPG